MIQIYTDGGSRGNPGPAGIGVYIVDGQGNELYALGQKIGIATNNVAEYKAVIAALSWLAANAELLSDPIIFLMDSLLVVSQITGVYRAKDPQMAAFLQEVRVLEQSIPHMLAFKHIPREQNKQADKLVNLALDNRL